MVSPSITEHGARWIDSTSAGDAIVVTGADRCARRGAPRPAGGVRYPGRRLPPAPDGPPPRTRGLQQAGWLGAAKLWFLLAGYGLNVALTHLVSSATYGQVQTVARAIAVPNMVLIHTLMFAVSRPLAAELDEGCPSYDRVRRAGRRLALGLGCVATGATLLAAPWLARAWDDPELAIAIRVVAPVSLVYALYAVNVGTLNALRRFSRQAALDITMATLKAGLMGAAAALALGLPWIVAGFTTAAACVLGLSFVLLRGVRPPAPGPARSPARGIARFAATLVVFTAVVNLLQSIDLLVLSGASETIARKNAVGHYSSAQLVAWVPYSLMNAVTLVAFPMVATIVGRGDVSRTTEAVRVVATTTLTLLVLMSSIAAAASAEIQALLFPRAYAAAAEHLQLMVVGFSGYSFANNVAWVCNGAGHHRSALGLVSVPLGLVAVLCAWLCPPLHAHGAALSVLVAGTVAVGAAWFVLRRRFAVRVPWGHVLKLGLAAGAVGLVASLMPVPTAGGLGKLAIVGKLAVLLGVFVGVVLATKAVTIEQLRQARRGGGA